MGERVQVVNVNNGARFEIYVLKGERKSGVICVNGAAARKVAVGDIVIIIAYLFIAPDVAKDYKSVSVFPDENNRLTL